MSKKKIIFEIISNNRVLSLTGEYYGLNARINAIPELKKITEHEIEVMGRIHETILRKRLMPDLVVWFERKH